MPACYFHLLLVVATAGCGVALLVLARGPAATPRVGAPVVLCWRTSLSRMAATPLKGSLR